MDSWNRSGGPAFPRGQFAEIPNPHPRIEAQDGMTLLDHFAGIALYVLLGNVEVTERRAAQMAYQQGLEMVRVKRELEENDYECGEDLEEGVDDHEILETAADIFPADSAEQADAAGEDLAPPEESSQEAQDAKDSPPPQDPPQEKAHDQSPPVRTEPF